MTIIILTQCPTGLRGFLTRWLMEISPGVFIGGPSARVREALWREVRQYAGAGRALLAYTTNNEQGFTFETWDHKWHPVDYEGVTLIRRPKQRPAVSAAPPPSGWSKASKRRRYRR
ncbi:type I-E CRISPR-associated endoribonuclease Cas2e [Thermomonospora catenispora]|uniref:type I-E CRISPR-associated endoribonuclease Cas2e n=1 Tax=Thermomonospora catenispora TaxID=2493090 RepID=UPI0011213E11|nr:type I-E CRISPR-associated endoribonuclease Cas2e [Thermomonospora catenispora]TNY37279.1 type I-E CRISPR-associated endoribonuclease Cas2 [Thermomonospora catenispora]